MFYLIGLGIGLTVALIFCLIIHFTLFKQISKKKVLWFYIIMFVIFGFTGSTIFGTQFKNNSDVNTVTPQELMTTLTDTISDNWSNSNGGFTFEQIQEVQKDSSAPTIEDQVIDLSCYDFGDYVVFSYKSGDIYQNALFYKSGNGLILDGMINMNAWMYVDVGFFNTWYNFESFKWVSSQDKEPYYFEKRREAQLDDNYDDLCSISRRSVKFLNRDKAWVWSPTDGEKFALQQLPKLTATNVTSNFIKFGDVELIGVKDTGYTKINSFYNYLYEQIKGQSYDTSKLIDATDCLCLPIPKDIQSNYSISVDKKSDYNGADFYGVYKCDIAVNLLFKKGNSEAPSSTRNDDYINTLKNDSNYVEDVTVETIETKKYYSKVDLKFTDTSSSDLTNVDLTTSPVKITFTDTNNEQKIVLINDKTKLSGTDVLLIKDMNYSYLIESEKLVFESFRGTFKITDDLTSLNFNYYYLDNFTLASVGLNAVGTVDTSQIDLGANPVKIILSNDNHTYQFSFENNDDLNKYKNMLVEMGTYNYTILSKQLIFASVSGTLTITTTDRVMLFNYALGIKGELSFNVSLTQNGTTNNKFSLYSEADNVSLIRDTLSSAKVYLVNCVIYDKDGKIMENFTHTHQVTGSCGDSWTASHLVVGETYTLQLRFTDRDDTTKTYLSDITTFTFQNNYCYKVVYTATKNN